MKLPKGRYRDTANSKMKPFDYTAQCDGGAAISGTIEAPDGDEALKHLVGMRLSNIDLREAKGWSRHRPIRGDDFIFFNEQLATLAASGTCLDVGLRQLGKDLQSSRLRRVLDEVAGEIEKGVPLDEAVSSRANRLPALYARVVKAGVATGKLSATLLNLSHHLRQMAETKRLMWEALAYPGVVLVMACGLVCTVLMFLIPQFEIIFTDFQSSGFYVQTPALSTFIFDIARVFPSVLGWIGLVVAVIAFGLLAARFSRSGRLLQEQLLLKIPILGRAVRDSIRARFLRAMGFSVGSGIPLPEAVRLAADAAASPNLRRDAETLAKRVEQGQKAYEACRNLVIVPPMFGYVVEVNEDRNNLEHGLIELSKSYEMRAGHGQNLLRAWLAPLGIVLVGGLIGMCVLALFLPLISILQSVS